MAGNLTRDEARLRAAIISETMYDVALDLTGGPETFGCEATIRFRCSQPGASTFVEYNAPAAAAELNGRPLPADSFDGLRIRLADLKAENELVVRGTSRYENTGVGMHRFSDPEDGQVYLYTDSEPYDIHRVYPCFDQPDIKASLQLSVLAPQGWTVISNAPGSHAASEAPPGGRANLWSFPRTRPLPTYVTAVVAGPYHGEETEHRGMRLGVWCRQSLARHLDPAEIFEVTRQGFDYYEQAFGYPYPFGKYDQIFVPEFNAGAMENAACVTFSERHIFRSKVTEAAREARADTILHELAHMWFGDLVTMRWWDDLWLNESFATFMSHLAMASATRFSGIWTTFCNGWKTWAYRQDQLPTTHPIAADMPDIDSVKINFDGITYAKGASVLRQLVSWVGQEEFLTGVASYFLKHEYANTTLEDFLDALEERSGRDLRAWSSSWLATSGVNVLTPALGDSERIGRFTIRQSAAAGSTEIRSHRLAVGLYRLDGDSITRTKRVELDVTGPETVVPELEGEAVPEMILINDDDLTYAKIRLDERSLRNAIERLCLLPDPLARALCWSAAWDMVRDAEMPARDYARLVIANIAGETEISAVQSILSQAASALQTFGDPSNLAPAMQALSSAALANLEAAAPGSDHQLAWARCFVATARAKEQLGTVAGLLEGTRSFPGLAVDTDLRWHIVTALAAAGAAGQDLVDAEAKIDPTDAGARYAMTARAAIPHPASKAQAWESIAEDTDLPLASMRALMGGFQQPEQTTHLEPYRDRYFSSLGRIWAERNPEVALSFSGAMFPGSLIDAQTVARTEEYLRSEDPPGPLRRILLEGKDAVERALRARAADSKAGSPG